MNRVMSKIPPIELLEIGAKIYELRTEGIGWKYIYPQFRLSPEVAKKIYRKHLEDNGIKEVKYKSGRQANNERNNKIRHEQ